MSNRKLTACLVAALTAAAVPMAHAAAPAFLSGGVGHESAEHMHAAAKHYSLQIEFSERRDKEFIADADLKIADAHGKTVLHRTGVGPIALVRLAPGTYHVTAKADGRSETQTAKVRPHETEHLYFHWKPMAHDAKAAT